MASERARWRCARARAARDAGLVRLRQNARELPSGLSIELASPSRAGVRFRSRALTKRPMQNPRLPRARDDNGRTVLTKRGFFLTHLLLGYTCHRTPTNTDTHGTWSPWRSNRRGAPSARSCTNRAKCS